MNNNNEKQELQDGEEEEITEKKGLSKIRKERKKKFNKISNFIEKYLIYIILLTIVILWVYLLIKKIDPIINFLFLIIFIGSIVIFINFKMQSQSESWLESTFNKDKKKNKEKKKNIENIENNENIENKENNQK